MLDLIGPAIAIAIAVIAVEAAVRFLLPPLRKHEYFPLRAAVTFSIVVLLIRYIPIVRVAFNSDFFLVPALFAAVITDCVSCFVSMRMGIVGKCAKKRNVALYDMSCPNISLTLAMSVSPVPSLLLLQYHPSIAHPIIIYYIMLFLFVIIDILYKHVIAIKLFKKNA